MKSKKKEQVEGLLLIVPLVVAIAVLSIYPTFEVLSTSFYERGLFSRVGEWIGLQNYRWLLSSSEFWTGVKRSLIWTGGNLIFQIILGLAVALLLHKDFWGRNIARGGILFSYLMPIVVAVLVWKFLFNDVLGLIPHLVSKTNLPISGDLFSSPKTAMLGVIIFSVWKHFPFMTLCFLARLQTIDTSLYEAARIDGAGKIQLFRYITLPLLKPVIGIVLLLRSLWTFNKYVEIALLTGGGPGDSTETLPLLVYETAFGEWSLGKGTTVAAMIFLFQFSFVILYIYWYKTSIEEA